MTRNVKLPKTLARSLTSRSSVSSTNQLRLLSLSVSIRPMVKLSPFTILVVVLSISLFSRSQVVCSRSKRLMETLPSVVRISTSRSKSSSSVNSNPNQVLTSRRIKELSNVFVKLLRKQRSSSPPPPTALSRFPISPSISRAPST